ncbi:VPS9 domain-containing protein [Aspergillus clavatus NRRL 1]|uniref:VPS9 domain protein, putative n=1 Tax=Aspergillus clavatus (strain ATCC 1007 / CBS 513.65 / DSM 816 / NCTC 3887 / NRRL 1 / QM 1276 / 107) TaxID=344612 RepID=A1C6D5_ASPCL|nr:VPS9 domain protein, putative [Aspergillus clavatus NRRL 1]EAW13956.1 VPS9 domain protein, putative [Aspergillus clavatus NRRL 1]
MSSHSSISEAGKPRLHTVRSFPRMDNPEVSSFARNRAKTVQSVAIPEAVESTVLPIPLSPESEPGAGPDLFEKRGSSDSSVRDDGHLGEEVSVLSLGIHEQPEELPIELISLTDRFVNSLTVKVHSSPPTIEKISHLFQDFYVRAESHIATHISALASRINRDPSPNPPPPKGTRGFGQPRPNNKDSTTVISGRQMLTASEVTERRKARKSLASKGPALEEAIERRACESIYDKIWRHKSTLDEVRDEKLRSKTAALLLIGINLKDLGIDIDLDTVSEERQKEADHFLSVARDCLAKMNDVQYPLGKLQYLAAAHKAIVDALTKLLPSSSSADEILPTLIYTLVTCPPEGINIISNLLFIQRFRSSSKIDGETAYCLTNLEAAISFLENVELSELRTDETPEGQLKTSTNNTTPASDTIDTVGLTNKGPLTSVTKVDISSVISKPDTKEADFERLSKPQQPPVPQQGRLNNLFQPPAKVLGAANDAVRNTADQSLKNIGATLDSSFNFLFGRLKELQSSQLSIKDGDSPILPKTLAEARRLVTAPSSVNENFVQDENAIKDSLTVSDRPPLRRIGSKAEDTFMGLVSGHRTPRDRSADSVRTQTSSRKATMIADSQKAEPSSTSLPPSSLPTTPLESMRNFGNSLNPLNHIPGMIRSFGRSTSDSPGNLASLSPSDRTKASPLTRELPTTISDSRPKLNPPIQRFLQTSSANELTIGDVSILLEDYKRLASALFGSTPDPK